MRTRILENPVFLQGLVAGLAVAGVAVVIYGAVRRGRLRAGLRAGVSRVPDRTIIDGARPINPVDLDLQSPPETRSADRRLESEGPDPALVTQRW